MVKHKHLKENIAPENRKTLYEKLQEEKIEFQNIQIVKYKGIIGINCPDKDDKFLPKRECRACEEWLGGSGKHYYCLTKK